MGACSRTPPSSYAERDEFQPGEEKMSTAL